MKDVKRKHLKDYGLVGIKLIICDACLGLVEAAGEVFPERAEVRRSPQRVRVNGLDGNRRAHLCAVAQP